MNMGSDCRQPHSSSPLPPGMQSCPCSVAVSTTVISSLHATKTTLHVSRHSLHLTDPPYQLYCVDFVGYEAGTHQTDTDGPLGDHGTSLVDSLATPSYIPPLPRGGGGGPASSTAWQIKTIHRHDTRPI
jgi:hypothetical protein